MQIIQIPSPECDLANSRQAETIVCRPKLLQQHLTKMEMETDWSDYGFQWLFSPDSSNSYLPIEEQVKQYKTRNLETSKMFIMASKLWDLGANRSRRRIITAPSMIDKPRASHIQASSPLKSPKIEEKKSDGRTRKGEDWALSKMEQQQAHEEEIEERTAEYKQWYSERVKLRQGLENLGLSENWLHKKIDLTPLEKRVCNKMEEDRKAREAERLKPPPQPTKPSSKQKQRKPQFHWQTMNSTVGAAFPGGPKVIRPIPEGLAIIIQYLSRRRQRVVDLFSRADKDKSWGLSRKEFKHAIEEAGIPVSDEQLTEAIDCLDTDGDDQVDYRELVAGVRDYRLLERAKAKSRQSMKSALNNNVTVTVGDSAQQEYHPSRSASAMSDRTATSSPAGSTSSNLELPKTDLTEKVDLLPDDMVEKRKKEKLIGSQRTRSRRKKRGDKIKTGNAAIDNHSLRSTLGGDVGKAVNKYREARLKEYHQICQLCEKNGVAFTPELLQKAILHPGDKPHRRIRNHIRQPGTQTISSHFADPPEPPESPSEYHDPDKVIISKTGELYMEAKHAYPLKQEVSAEAELMNLSSGKAFVRRKIDCWMTFEDYDRLTNHLGKRYVNISESGVDTNAFWPGQLLDKIRLCMPSGRNPSSDCFFSTTKQHKPVNTGYTYNNLKWWPVSDACYVKPADIEQHKKYSIDWK